MNELMNKFVGPSVSFAEEMKEKHFLIVLFFEMREHTACVGPRRFNNRAIFFYFPAPHATYHVRESGKHLNRAIHAEEAPDAASKKAQDFW